MFVWQTRSGFTPAATRAMCCVVAALAIVLVGAPAYAQEQAFEVGAHFALANSDQFDDSDPGVGVRLSWYPQPTLGIEGEFTFFPDDLDGTPAFSPSRVEGLFGATFGPVLGRVRPFARVRPGFLRYGEADGPVACIAIFPPPLSCVLAEGKTLFALDLGGGVEWHATNRFVVRADLGDRMVRYPGPALDADGDTHDDNFTGHDFRFAIGAGVRF